MVDKAEAEPLRDLPLQRFEFGIDEFDHLAGFDVDHVIVVGFGRGFIPRATVSEVMTVEDSGFLEKAHGAIDRGDRNARIELRRPFVQLLHIGVIGAFRQDFRDHATLFGDAKPAFGTKRLDINRLVHDISVNQKPRPSF